MLDKVKEIIIKVAIQPNKKYCSFKDKKLTVGQRILNLGKTIFNLGNFIDGFSLNEYNASNLIFIIFINSANFCPKNITRSFIFFRKYKIIFANFFIKKIGRPISDKINF